MVDLPRTIYAKINQIGFKGDENVKSTQTLHDKTFDQMSRIFSLDDYIITYHIFLKELLTREEWVDLEIFLLT